MTQIIVRSTSDTDVHEFHIEGEQICDLPYVEFTRPLWGDAMQRFSELGVKGQAIAESLMATSHENEIERITFRPNSVRVYRAPMAVWGPLESKVVVPSIKAALDDPSTEAIQYEDFVKRHQLVHA